MKKSFIINVSFAIKGILRILPVCFLLIVVLFSGETDGNYVWDLQSGSSTTEFNIGYSPSVFRNTNLTDAQAASKIFLQAILKQVNSKMKSESIIIHDLINNTNAINKKELDVVTMTGLEYLAVQNLIRLYPFAVPVVGDSCLNKLVILTRKDSGINSLSDLRNKNIKMESAAYADNLSILKIWLKVLFYKNKIEFNGENGKSAPRGELPSRTITSVFFKKCDAAVVLENEFKIVTELNPQVGKELKVLSESKPMLLAISCYTEKQKKAEEHDLLISTIFKLHETAAGKNFIKLFKIKKFVPFKNEYLKNVSELFTEYQTIQKMKPKFR